MKDKIKILIELVIKKALRLKILFNGFQPALVNNSIHIMPYLKGKERRRAKLKVRFVCPLSNKIKNQAQLKISASEQPGI